MSGEGVKRKRGGRAKGSLNRETRRRQLLAETGMRMAIDSGVMPLQVMLQRMQDPESVTDAQFAAACAAAPYCHAKISAIAIATPPVNAPQVDLSTCTVEELALLARLLDRPPASPAPPLVIDGVVLEEVGELEV